MPHVTVEYIDSLGDDACIPESLQVMSETLTAQNGVFLIGDIHLCAIKLTEYRVVDGRGDDALVYVTFKIVGGRTPEVKKAAYDALFKAIKAHSVRVFTHRYLTLSMELTEFDEDGSYKHNNIRVRFRKA